jgi:hypothetical protein
MDLFHQIMHLIRSKKWLGECRKEIGNGCKSDCQTQSAVEQRRTAFGWGIPLKTKQFGKRTVKIKLKKEMRPTGMILEG